MKRFTHILMTSLAAMAVTASAVETENLTLMTEASSKIEVPSGVTDIYISNDNIIDAKPGPDVTQHYYLQKPQPYSFRIVRISCAYSYTIIV